MTLNSWNCSLRKRVKRACEKKTHTSSNPNPERKFKSTLNLNPLSKSDRTIKSGSRHAAYSAISLRWGVM